MTPEQARVLAQYNTDMNGKIFAATGQLSPEEQKRDVGAFFKSVHGTLNHILWADGMWLSRFEGRESPGGGFDHELASSFDELLAMRQQMDIQITRWSATLSSQWLEGEFSWTTMAGEKMKLSAWLLVTHLFNHATHHRGQVTTLLTQQGIDIGVTDLPRVISE